MDTKYCVYIITNKYNTVLYTGVTNNLGRRIYQHKNKLSDGFTKRYNCDKLVWYEQYDDPYNAILREKQIKGHSRGYKVSLIEEMNIEWKDLYNEVLCL